MIASGLRLVAGLPADPDALSAIVRGLLVHNFTAKVQGLTFPAERMSHMQTVGAEAILDYVFGLDPAPLGFERAAERRMVGFCYHFALLHCALLRATGTPARIRCGFADYFEARRWIDHWVVEYWDGDGWLLTDPQTGRSDLTSDDFQDGPSAWNQCRGGASLPALYRPPQPQRPYEHHRSLSGGRPGHAIQARLRPPPLKIVCARYLGTDPRDDLVRLVLGDLDELVLQVATLSGDQFWAEFPGQVPGEYFIGSAAILGVGTPEHPGWPLRGCSGRPRRRNT